MPNLHGCQEPGQLLPDWPRDFGRAGAQRLELEIGPGHGAFALDHVAAHPEVDLVCIETRRADVELIKQRAARRQLSNLQILHGDARLLLPNLFATAELQAVHIHCPDPWWKQRHHKRRLVDAGLALLLRRLLREGGEVDFRTDVPAYAREALVTWEAAGYRGAQLIEEPPEVLSTRERRYAQTGQPVFRALLVNPGSPPADILNTKRTGREWTDVRRK